MTKLIDLDLDPDERTLRQFGFIAFVGFGVLAALAYFERLVFSFGLGEARVPVAVGLAAVGALALLLGLFAPRGNRVIYVALSLVAFPIGLVLSHLIMGALYFLIIGPIAVVLRLLGRDSLTRRVDPEAQTYWVDAHPPRDKESYFHQY